jgi:hypothetical protein
MDNKIVERGSGSKIASATKAFSTRLAPGYRWSESIADFIRYLAFIRNSSDGRLVEQDSSVYRHLEHALNAGPKLNLFENRCPSICNLGRHTDGHIQMVSRNAVFDYDLVIRTYHGAFISFLLLVCTLHRCCDFKVPVVSWRQTSEPSLPRTRLRAPAP